jgi:hypothetical protein
MTQTGNSAGPELLLTEIQIFETAVLRNEEIGEKRFEFFVALMTAVGGGLVLLWTGDRAPHFNEAELIKLTWEAIFVVLLFGIATFFRMRHRDNITAEYKGIANLVRKRYREYYADHSPELRNFELPFERRNTAKEKLSKTSIGRMRLRLGRISHMGFTSTLAILNGILVVPFSVLALGQTVVVAVVIGVAAMLLLWLVGSAAP